MGAPSFENLLLEVDGAIATVTFNRPKALNALNEATLRELKQATEYIAGCAPARGGDHEIKVVILTGAGEKAFVAGADIKEMSEKDVTAGVAFAEFGQSVTAALEALPQPTIAAVNGFALGGGCEFAMACDFIVASENAVLGQPEVGLGIIPGFGGCVRLARYVGAQRARELIYTGRKIKADEAKAIGLVTDVVPQAELIGHVRKIAESICKASPLAVAISKKVINNSLHLSITDGLKQEAQEFGKMFSSHDQKEGMGAFVEKRAAVFKGE